MNMLMPHYLCISWPHFSDFETGPRLAKEPLRELPEEPHDPEIRPDLPPEQQPDLSPEIPDEPAPEIFPDRYEPEISPSPELCSEIRQEFRSLQGKLPPRKSWRRPLRIS